MNKYRVICTLWKLPKHQRRKIQGKAVSKTVLGRNLIAEKSIYITSAELEQEWDHLKELYSRGEAEVRNPDGTLLRFVKEVPVKPPEDKIEKLPMAQTTMGYDADLDSLDDITPLVEPIKKAPKEAKPKRKKRAKKSK